MDWFLWLSDKALFLYTHTFSYQSKNINISLGRVIIKMFVKISTPRHIKNANSLKLFQFYFSQRDYFRFCEYDTLMGSRVFLITKNNISENPKEYGVQTLLPLPGCAGLQKSLHLCALVFLASR